VLLTFEIDGKYAFINLEAIAEGRGELVGKTIKAWCEERRRAQIRDSSIFPEGSRAGL